MSFFSVCSAALNLQKYMTFSPSFFFYHSVLKSTSNAINIVFMTSYKAYINFNFKFYVDNLFNVSGNILTALSLTTYMI